MKNNYTLIKKGVLALAFFLFTSSAFATLPSVLIAAAASSTWVSEVQSKLVATGQFSSVQTYITSTGTPTLSSAFATLPSVLIAAAASSTWVSAVQSKLVATGQFSSVQTY